MSRVTHVSEVMLVSTDPHCQLCKSGGHTGDPGTMGVRGSDSRAVENPRLSLDAAVAFCSCRLGQMENYFRIPNFGFLTAASQLWICNCRFATADSLCT